MPSPFVDSHLVLDAWPVMEWFRGKTPAGVACGALMLSAAQRHRTLSISRINLGEIYYLTAKDFSIPAAATLVAQVKTFAEVVSVTDADVDDAARLKARFNISYADAFAATLSVRRDIPVLTGDPEFRVLEAAGVLTLHWVGA